VPTYEYQCDKCGRTFEVRQRISEPPLESCEACGGKVHRLISSAPFILKGEGWYVTDYPSEARKKALESEKSSAGGDGKKGDGKKGDDKKSEKSEKSEKKDGAPAKATTSASAPASAPPTSTPSPSSSD
jgi:putative FmdB family regulatory protein